MLSYPAIESYLLSCIQEDVFQQSCLLGRDLKPELIKITYSEESIESEVHLIHAVVEMDKGLESFGIDEYDLDNLAPTLLGVYDGQQQKYVTDQKFSLLSLVSMALLELGVVVECED